MLESELVTEVVDRYVLRGRCRTRRSQPHCRARSWRGLTALPPPKRSLSLLPCIGREFSHEMLAAASPLEADALRAALDELSDNQLIDRSGLPSAQVLWFRHALVQEAAYQSLPKTRRRELHARIADIVEARFPEIIARQPEWLAHHHAQAGNLPRAHRSAARGGAPRKVKLCPTRGGRASGEMYRRRADVLSSMRLTQGRSSQRRRELEALEMLGDLASLMDDLAVANKRYDQALMLASADDDRIRIENGSAIGRALHPAVAPGSRSTSMAAARSRCSWSARSPMGWPRSNPSSNSSARSSGSSRSIRAAQARPIL